MTKRVLAVAFSLIFASLSRPQETQTPVTNCTSPMRSSRLICAIPNLFGPNGLLLLPKGVGNPPVIHQPHFNSNFESGFAPLGSAIGTELTLLPLASPASSFTYTIEEPTGIPRRTQQSFGPILAERGETIGKGQYYFAVTYQYFTFDALDGVDLGKLHEAFYHDDPTAGGYHSDFITTNNSFKLYVNQVTAFATVGVARNVDVSLALPILQVRFNGNSDASLHWTVDPLQGTEPHVFPSVTDPNGTTTKSFRTASSASGIGDLTVRVKAAVRQGEHASLAFAADVRFPTGNEENFLGSGAFGIKPFLIASFRSGRWAPHVNAGYQINGNSFLAGDFTGFEPANPTQPRPATKGHLPNNLFYTVGADVGATRSLTLSFDFLGQNVFGAKIIAPVVFKTLAPEVLTPGVTAAPPYATTSVKLGNFDVQTGSAGMKVKLGADFLLTANVLFQLNNNGLRARVVPLIGLSYTH
jgi:hypothetical protein